MNFELAKKTVDLLGIEAAVKEKIDLIYQRLSEDEQEAEDRAQNGRKLSRLVALLPTINIFINYASSRTELKAAQKWLGQELGIENREELMSLLATLTLYYIAEYGAKNDAPERVEMWERISKHLSEVEAEVTATPAFAD